MKSPNTIELINVYNKFQGPRLVILVAGPVFINEVAALNIPLLTQS